MMDVVILAGGFGTRLQQVVKDVPKPMALVAGRPFLEYIFDWLSKYQIRHVVLAVSYKKDTIIKYFGKSYKEISIDYSIEETPLGTGGGIKKALKKCSSDYVLIINGDTYFNVNINDMENYYKTEEPEVLVAVKKIRNCYRYGAITINSHNRITNFREKNDSTVCLVSGGVYILKHDTLDTFPDAFSLEKDFFGTYINTIPVNAYISNAYFIDIGVPEDYCIAQHSMRNIVQIGDNNDISKRK